MDARLLILGVLHRGNFHPYEIKRRLENAMVECYIDVDVGSLYYAIRQLERDGFISTVSLLRRRISRLDQLIAKLEAIRKELRPIVATGGEQLLLHLDKQRRLDRDWLKGLLKDVSARRVHDVPDPRRLGMSTSGK